MITLRRPYRRMAVSLLLVAGMSAALVASGQAVSAAPAVATTTVQAENASAPWVYTGAWETGSGDRYTRAVGAEVTLSFQGSAIDLYGTKAAHHGIASVAVDGQAADVDAYAATRQEGALLRTVSGLTGGTHQLTVTLTDRTNPSRVPDGDPAFSLDRVVITAGGGEEPPPAAPGKITQQGTKLFLDGRQYKFAGLNADTWFGCWDGEKAATTDANLDRYFGELNPRSMTRIWAYPRAYDAGLLERIVSAAERHGQYLMVTLTDGNDDGEQCGGLPENYGDPSAMLDHVRTVVPAFADRNAVAVWEVCNECSIDPGETKSWYRAVTDGIRAADPDGLITIGGATCYTTSIPLEDCVSTNDLPNNNLVSIHEYDDNDGDVSHWADETAQIARRLDIPAFVGETGVTNGGGDCGAQTCNAERMKQEWTAYLNAPEYAGMLFWDFKWAHPDPTTVNLDTPMWDAASEFRHQYQG